MFQLTAKESRLDKKFTTQDEAIAAILSPIRQLMHPPVPQRLSGGFTADLRTGRTTSYSAELHLHKALDPKPLIVSPQK